jgi:hypothetical protein
MVDHLVLEKVSPKAYLAGPILTPPSAACDLCHAAKQASSSSGIHFIPLLTTICRNAREIDPLVRVVQLAVGPVYMHHVNVVERYQKI